VNEPQEYFIRIEADLAMLKTLCTHLLVKQYEHDKTGLLKALDEFESLHLKAGKIRPRGFDPAVDRECGRSFKEFCKPIRDAIEAGDQDSN